MLISITLNVAIYMQPSSLHSWSAMSKNVMFWVLTHNSICSWISCLMAYNLVTRICIEQYLPQGSALLNKHNVSIVVGDVNKVLLGFKDLLLTIICNDFSMCWHLILDLEPQSYTYLGVSFLITRKYVTLGQQVKLLDVIPHYLVALLQSC